jgi:hypothetical protein
MVVPVPVGVRHGRHRLRADETGLSISHGRRHDSWPWDTVAALGVDHPPSYVLLFLARGISYWLRYLRRPCLYVCIRGDTRPHPALAVRFPRRTDVGARHHAEAELMLLRETLDGWLDRTSTRGIGQPDVGVWWYDQREAHPEPEPRPMKQPSMQERAAAVERDLDRLRDELDHLRREH